MPMALTLSGSIRAGSVNVRLQEHVNERLAAAGVTVNAITLADYPMPIFNQDFEPDAVPEAAVKLAGLFRASDMIFLANPEYNGGVTPLMVNTITWLSRQKPNPFRNAVFGIGGVSSGKYGTIWSHSHLRDSLVKLGALVVPTLLGIGPASEAFREDGGFAEKSVNAKIEQMVLELTSFSRGGV